MISIGISGSTGLSDLLMNRSLRTYKDLLICPDLEDVNNNYHAMLKNNYRSHPEILKFSNRYLYNNKLESKVKPEILNKYDKISNIAKDCDPFFNDIISSKKTIWTG